MSNTQAERVEALMTPVLLGGACTSDDVREFRERITSLVAENEALRADAERLDWIEQRTKLNSDGISQQDMQPARHVKFTILPAWDQNGEVANLRQSIDAARNTAQQQGG